MMKYALLLIFGFFCHTSLRAGEDLVVFVNNKGILKLLKEEAKLKTSSSYEKKLIIDAGTYPFVYSQQNFQNNQLVTILNEVTNLNLSRDLHLNVETSPISVQGTLDQYSLDIKVIRQSSSFFDFSLAFDIDQISLNTEKISLIEKSQHLNASALNVSITNKNPFKLKFAFRVRTDQQFVRAELLTIESNIKENNDINVDLSDLILPPTYLVINGVKKQLDTSGMKNELLKRKYTLAKNLLNFAHEYVGKDLVRLINSYLHDESFAKNYELFCKENEENLLVRAMKEIKTPPRDGVLVTPIYLDRERPQSSVTSISKKLFSLIKEMKMDVHLQNISTRNGEDLRISSAIDLFLNGKNLTSRQGIHQISAIPNDRFDLSLSVSESFLNSILYKANETGLFQQINHQIIDVKGLEVRGVKIHFTGKNSLKLVIHLELNLNKLSSSSWKEWFYNNLGAFLERNNNQGVITFPLEIPVSFNLQNVQQNKILNLNIGSSFCDGELGNDFNYKSNVQAMDPIVKEAVMMKIEESLSSFANKNFLINISPYFNHEIVELTPQNITIDQDNLEIDFDIKKILKRSK